MKHFANEDKTPFYKLTDKEQACLARASIHGGIQFWSDDEWLSSDTLYFDKGIYRTKPNSLDGKIPWDLIDDKFVAFAIDKDMSAWFYTSVPSIDFAVLCWNSSDYVHYESILKLDIDGIDWKESLVMRPGHE